MLIMRLVVLLLLSLGSLPTAVRTAETGATTRAGGW
jgi:hypothetical protein